MHLVITCGYISSYAATACAEAEGEWPVGAGEHSTVQKMVLKRTNGKECLYFEGLSMMT